MLLFLSFFSSIFLTISSNSIFGDPQPLIPQEDLTPEYAQDEDDFLSVSGNDLAALYDQLQQQAADTEDALSSLSDDIQLLASGSGSAAEAYLSATIIDVMERVVNGHPFCRYAAYRVSYDDANAGTLVYGSRSDYTPTTLTIYNAYLVQYYRYRATSTAQWQYRYTVTPMDQYTISFGSNTLLYTNCLDGYPTLGINYSGIVVLLLIALGVFLVFRKGD